jgi:hypothetical protein
VVVGFRFPIPGDEGWGEELADGATGNDFIVEEQETSVSSEGAWAHADSQFSLGGVFYRGVVSLSKNGALVNGLEDHC